jgi:hypothetical protein
MSIVLDSSQTPEADGGGVINSYLDGYGERSIEDVHPSLERISRLMPAKKMVGKYS